MPDGVESLRALTRDQHARCHGGLAESTTLRHHLVSPDSCVVFLSFSKHIVVFVFDCGYVAVVAGDFSSFQSGVHLI